MDTKVCTGCKEEKPVSCFSRRGKDDPRPRTRCQACAQAAAALRPKPKLDPEKAKARRQRWLDKNPEYMKDYQRQRHQDDPERLNAPRRKGGPRYEHVKADVNRRRALKASAEGSHTVEEWLALCEHHEHRCLACGRDDRPLTRDHVVPLIAGGTDYIDNIQPLCKPCNSSKGTNVIDFRSNNDTCELPG